MKTWKPEVQTRGDDKWYDNNLVFATEKEAAHSAEKLYARWTLCTGHRAVESTDPVNYRIDWDSMEMVPVKEIVGGSGVNAVMVGAPFEQQTIYGPFEDFESACDFADAVRNECTWVITLVDPKETNDDPHA